MYLTSLDSLLAVFTECVIAKTSKCLTRSCDARTLKACGFGADRSTTLELCAERIAHTCDKELDRRICDNGRIDHYSVGICGVEQIFIEAVVSVVNY